MAQLKVKVAKRRVGFGDTKKEMYVSKADRGGVYDIDDIAHQVALESGVNKRQFKAAVGAMVDAMIVFLKGGHGVSLKDFGTFLPDVKSQSSEDPDGVGVKRVRISFRPHKTLWEAVAQIGYVTENEFTATSPDSGTTEPDDEGTDDTGGESGGGKDFE